MGSICPEKTAAAAAAAEREGQREEWREAAEWEAFAQKEQQPAAAERDRG